MKRPKRMGLPHGEAGSEHEAGGESSCGAGSCGSCGFPADTPESERFTGPSPTVEQQERLASGGLSDESDENPVRNGPPPARLTD